MPGALWRLVKKYNNTHIEMKNTIKTTYAPPASEVLMLKTQGIICQSPTGQAGIQNYTYNWIPIE